MTVRLRRFLHLERPRRDDAPPAAPAARRRFDAVEVRSALPECPARLPDSATGRFRAPQGSGLALDVAPEGEQPFVRCATCETDHARHTTRCGRCGASLDTPEQRAFNERLWAARRSAAAEEDRAAETRREAQRDGAEEEARVRRAMGEAMAEGILRRERDRLREPWLDRALSRVRGLFSRSG